MNLILSAITHCSSPIGEAGRGLLFILWNPSLNFGPFRWYSLCWLIGLALAYFIVRHLFYEQGIAERTIKKNGKKEVENVFDPLFIYCFLGILIGARLGHCLFYQPDYFLTSGKHIVEMLLPIHFMADGGWKFTGYEGLASHGGTLGLIIALWLYVRYSKISIWTVLDNIAIATGTTACFIRLGNLMNSEIIGKVTDVPWAFIFERVDSFCLTYIFTFRFLIEYTKDVQEAWEADMLFNMGQLLSIPFIIIGIYCMIRAKRKQN